MERYDIIILGTGPAGISAALTAKARNKRFLLIGSKETSTKVARAHNIQNYPGLPNIPGAEFAKKLLAHLDAMGIEITEDKITAVYAMGEYYALQGVSEMYEATAVIIGTGVVAGKPYPNEEALLGHGVSYCATCDAALYRGKSAIVIGFAPKEESEAKFLAEMADKVYYIPMYEDEVGISDCVEVIREKPVSIEADGGKAKGLQTDQRLIEADGVFILRDNISAGQLVAGLDMDGAHVKVDRRMTTNLPGCFACGDITGLPYQYVKAAGEGNVAALSAVSYVDSKKA